ncbi:ribosome rescue protein RqcH [Halanaeroarchaeum sulfurireducens]|uniref:Archaeal Rqc2 homolog aRqcH n=1 Tax=Halanaeroarchaeum sulfurireducens TaxID=1604004 RepID=A0A0F7PE47_9EURY|nr:ribosome rescue protein RqcH [Halanaeroarchaeum sulfurireducens]AKH97894.1 fibronectin-binding protein [Halanaeroarchaeum sulfurireducens]ALG82288.1 fibronectin-binding protein [Halanaeroarchaeum sulfurireducens]
MEPKREVSSVDLMALTRELSGYTGAKVDKAYLYDDDLIRLKMREYDRGRVELLIEVGETKRAHVARPEHVPEAPGRPPNFAKMLRNRIAGADFAAVRQHGFDRILEFEFRRGDADTTIVAELFGEGNLAVLDEAGEVVDSLQTIRLQSRTVAPGSQYGFPQSRVNPLEVDFESFVSHMEDSDTDVVRTLATQLNLGGLYGEEICTRADVEKSLDIADASEDEYERLFDAIQRLVDPIAAGETESRVYYEDDRRVDVTPMALEEYAHLQSEAFDSFNEALDDYFTNLEPDEDETTAAESGGPDFEGDIEQRERIIAQQEAAIEEFEADAEAEREKAKLVYGNYDLVDEVLSTVREAREAGHGWDDIEATLAEGAEAGIEAAEAVVDVDAADGMVTVRLDDHEIRLDPRHGVEKNADRLYTEAKRIEEKRDGALAAIEDTREELAELERRQAEWQARDEEEETDEEAEDVDWLSRSSIPVRKPETWYDRFRWFRTSDGFLVIGGRNADQNEEIVQKYMEPTDRFFHAQAHGGPVTVLKTSEPSEPSKDIDVPDRSLEEAAQFAVTYSTVWKDGKFSGDAYMVDPEQVSKTPESGEFLEKGGFAIRGDRTYFEDTPVGCAVGIICEPETRVIGGPPTAIEDRAETSVRLEPGRYAQGDAAKRMYREFRERFADTSFVRKVASPDEIQLFMPPGGSRMVE